MLRLIIRLIGDSSGASAAEYALVLAIIGGTIVFGGVTLGIAIAGAVDRASNNIAECGGGC